MRWSVLSAAVLVLGVSSAFSEDAYDSEVVPLLVDYCYDCHDSAVAKADLDLERFFDTAMVLDDREVWGSVYEKIESGQMPPPKKGAHPSNVERETILQWIRHIAALPDPQLGAQDPGQPVLRRLTRLEYNNTVRDLLALEEDIFMFPERLPFASKDYFDLSKSRLGASFGVSFREYGQKYPVLLPNSGLPGDNRTAHGYRNRGEAMNLSPLLLEKYVALAGEIVSHPDLPAKSTVFATLLGLDPAQIPRPVSSQSEVAAVVSEFAANQNVQRTAERSRIDLATFVTQAKEATTNGIGGVYDVPLPSGSQVVAGKGGLIRIQFGPAGTKTLKINPNEDLWLASFGTAEESSGSHLLTNKIKGQKTYELTFEIADGDAGEAIRALGVNVLGRRGQSGAVTLTAKTYGGTQISLTSEIREGAAGNTFYYLEAKDGERIKQLHVDGSQFTGDFVLLDDLAFLTDGTSQPGSPLPGLAKTPVVDVPIAKSKTAKLDPPRTRLGVFMKQAFRRPVDHVEVDRYFSLYQAALRSGRDEAEAMRKAVGGVLASPSFLYVVHPRHDASSAVYPLNSQSRPVP